MQSTYYIQDTAEYYKGGDANYTWPLYLRIPQTRKRAEVKLLEPRDCQGPKQREDGMLYRPPEYKSLFSVGGTRKALQRRWSLSRALEKMSRN